MDIGKRVPQGVSNRGKGLSKGQVVLSLQTAQAVRSLLKDLQQVLDDYSPMWYSQELSERLSAALKKLDEEQ
jgi:hypothetical protein